MVRHRVIRVCTSVAMLVAVTTTTVAAQPLSSPPQVGCDEAQSFYVSPPLRGDELLAWARGRDSGEGESLAA